MTRRGSGGADAMDEGGDGCGSDGCRGEGVEVRMQRMTEATDADERDWNGDGGVCDSESDD